MNYRQSVYNTNKNVCIIHKNKIKIKNILQFCLSWFIIQVYEYSFCIECHGPQN